MGCMYLIIKVLVSAFVIAGVSEVSKRSSFLGAALASLPLTSILALSWLYGETRDVQQVRSLSMGIFWMVLPSLIFFLTLNGTLKAGVRFVPALLLSCGVMSVSYALYVLLLKSWGIRLD